MYMSPNWIVQLMLLVSMAAKNSLETSCQMIADEGVAAEMHTFFGIEGWYISSYASPRLQPSLPVSLESTL